MEQDNLKPADQVKPEGRWVPVSAWGYLGIYLLLLIPLVNFILLIVWACGGCRKKNITRMAQGLLLFFALFLILGTIGTVFLVNNLKQLVADSDFGLPSLSSFKTVTKTLAEYGPELVQDIQTGDMEGIIEVWDSLDTEERTSLLDMASENDTISGAIQNVILPVPEEGKCYQTELSCGSSAEFAGYIQLAKTKGFYYEDYGNYGYSEPEAIENGYWFGSNGMVCVSAHYVGDTVFLEYISRDTAYGN